MFDWFRQQTREVLSESKCNLRERGAMRFILLATLTSIDALSTGTEPIRLHVEFCQQ